MDLEETGFTPRSGKKKKSSALSRLAAQRGKNTPRTSFTSDGGVGNVPKYPIDANVEIQNTAEAVDEDSDEGIGMTSAAYGAATQSRTADADEHVSDSSKLESSAGSTIKQMRQLNMASPLLEEDGETGEAKHKNDEVKGEKRLRDANSSGEELAADTGRRNKKYSHTDFENSKPSNGPIDSDSLHKGTKEDESSKSQGRIVPTNKVTPLEGSYQNTFRNERVNFSIQSPDVESTDDVAERRTRRSESANRENLTERYRDALEDQETDGFTHNEKSEMYDNLGDLRPGRSASPPPPFSRNYSGGSLQASLLTSWDREWSSMKKLDSGATDGSSSDKSYQSSSSLLPPVSTKDVKDRSFLVGSMNSRTSLLGSEELDRLFPERKMKIFVSTWNMCEMKELPENLDDFLLPDVSEFMPDAYVIGSQESTPNRKEWEIRLQETLGPHHVLFHSAAFGALYLSVFLRRDLIWFCSVSEEANISTRAGPAAIKTKGAVAVCFTFFGSSFLFVNSHLTPHDGKAKERAADYHKINSGLNLPKSTSSKSSPKKKNAADDGGVTSRFDCVFWAGDLNFRLEKERERLDKTIEGMKTQEIPNFGDLIGYDELFRIRTEELAFQEFQEGKIKFKPTYKYDIGTDNFDTSKKMRIPSYTDRVLFRCKKKNSISCLHYGAAEAMKQSDHRPVFAVFEVELRPGRDNIPLGGGTFDREVWLEGNKRRAAKFDSKKIKQKESTVCSLQ